MTTNKFAVTIIPKGEILYIGMGLSCDMNKGYVVGSQLTHHLALWAMHPLVGK